LEGGGDFTRGSLDIEVDGFTALKGTLAVETNLEAAGFNEVLEVVVLVKDFIDNVEAGPWISDSTNKLTLAVFNPGNGHFRSVQAHVSALAWSVE
jgi:hypothetical protein